MFLKCMNGIDSCVFQFLTMKFMKIIISVIFSFLFSNLACSQVSPLTEVNASELAIMNNTGNQVPFFGTKDELVQNFGQPNLKNVRKDADMIDYESESYAYNGINFIVENRPSNEILISFKITNSNYYIKYGNTNIKINDNIDDFIDVFPKSSNFMNNVEKKNWLRIEFKSLDSTFIPYSCQLIMSFDENTKLINMIKVFSG